MEPVGRQRGAMMSVAEASAVLGVKTNVLYSMIRNGDIPHHRYGRGSRSYIRLATTDVDAFIENTRVPARPPSIQGRRRRRATATAS